ncbi:receptor like protein [Trifolium repens]|nr:receptor like protein [Trifolium repens]
MKLALMFSSLLYFVTLMFMQNQGSCNGCLENERIGLMKIKEYIMSQKEGDPDNELGSWVDDRSSNCCSWNRVKCFNISFGRITHLSLGSLHFLSSDMMLINASLFRPFEELCFLDLSYIGFRGWMGNKGFPRLKKLEMLDLTYNYLNSSILPSLNGLHALKTLKLGSNLMNYFSAQGFPRLKKLETLDLSINNLNSSILSSLNGLTALKTLKLGSNFMNYFSAEGFLRTKELEILELSGNFLNCSTLPSLHGFTSLRSLMLSQNNFDCSFSALDFSKFSRLELLDLSNNQLIGSLHVEEVQNLRNLKMISLRNNHMNGSIEGLCKLKYLEELDISYNMFSAQLPECLSNLTNLKVLELKNNLLSGNFPSFTTNLTSLVHLSLYGNNMNGSFLLSTLANHSNLQNLSISSQNIGAHIETENTIWFPKFQLKYLVLRNCNINMEKGNVIPSFLSYQHNLILVDISRN